MTDNEIKKIENLMRKLEGHLVFGYSVCDDKKLDSGMLPVLIKDESFNKLDGEISDLFFEEELKGEIDKKDYEFLLNKYHGIHKKINSFADYVKG